MREVCEKCGSKSSRPGGWLVALLIVAATIFLSLLFLWFDVRLTRLERSLIIETPSYWQAIQDSRDLRNQTAP